jgi:hypothetical protein
MNFQGTGWGKGVAGIDLVQDTDKWSLLVNMVMKV